MTVNLKEARQQLGRLVDAAAKGEEVIITRNGEQMVRLAPVTGSQRPFPDLSAFRASLDVQEVENNSVVEDRRGARY